MDRKRIASITEELRRVSRQMNEIVYTSQSTNDEANRQKLFELKQQSDAHWTALNRFIGEPHKI